MENNELRKFIEKVKNIRLNDNERSVLRQSLLDFISKNPVRPGMNIRLAERRGLSFWPALFTTRLSFASGMAAVLLLTVLVGGGVTLGAEKAMPGDALYPVKVNFNEEVIALATVSEEAKTNWEIERANRRLQEAETLASQGSLNAESRQKIETNFEVQADKVRERIKKLEAKEDFDAAVTAGSNLETALNAHVRILSKLAEGETKEKQHEVKTIETRIRSRASETKNNRKTNEGKISAKASSGAEVSTGNKLNEAEIKIEEVSKFISLMEVKLGPEATVDAKARLDLARKVVVDGKAKVEAKSYGEAFVLFQKAVRISQEAKLLVGARANLNVQVEINSGDYHDDEDDDDYHDSGGEIRTGPGSGGSGTTGGSVEVELGL